MSLESFRKELNSKAKKDHAKILQRFFKTGPGEYGEGDIFIGLKVPVIRSIVKTNLDLTLKEIQELLKSPIHEERLSALLILVKKFEKANETEKEKIFNFYLKNIRFINNWDLVDLSAPNIVGNYLLNRDKKLLYNLAKSEKLWEKRIAILSTFSFIKDNRFDDSLKISDILLNDKHDLIHKGVGWMLREIGKRSLATEEEFLKNRYKNMPRTMLRYSIEKFPEKKRQAYLKGKI